VKAQKSGLTNEQRREIYLRQTGRKELTPAQQRRIDKKARQGKG
jgi:hypothetical protein